MTKPISSKAASPSVGPIQAIVVLLVMIPVLGFLLFLAEMFDIASFMFAGMLFILYWAGIKEMAAEEFAPSLVGALGGLGLAYLFHELPAALGMAGAIAVGVALLLAIYLLIRGQASIMINSAFMLFLTIATSLAFKSDAHYAAAAASVALAAGYAGGLVLIGKAISSRRSKAVETPAD